MNSESKSLDSIDIFAVVRKLWGGRVALVISLFVSLGATGLLYLILPPVYEASITLQTVDRLGGARRISPQLGGLASLAGINLGSGGAPEQVEAIETLRSRELIVDFIAENDLLIELFASKWNADNGSWDVSSDKVPTLWDGQKLFFKKILTVEESIDTSLVSLRIEWRDPEIAVAWAHEIVRRANEKLRARAQKDAERNLIFLREQMQSTEVAELRSSIADMIKIEMETAMLADVSDEYAFRTLDPAMVPDLDDVVRPRLFIMLGFGAVLGLLVGSCFVLLQSVASGIDD